MPGKDWAKIGAIAGVISIPIAILIGVAQCAVSISTSGGNGGGSTPPSSGADASTVSEGPQTGESNPAHPDSKIISEGTVSLKPGDFLNLETGKIDEDVHDVAYVEDQPNRLASTNGKIAQISGDATAAACAEELSQGASSTPQFLLPPGSWYCVMTRKNHYAAVQPLSNGASNEPNPFNFKVWG